MNIDIVMLSLALLNLKFENVISFSTLGSSLYPGPRSEDECWGLSVTLSNVLAMPYNSFHNESAPKSCNIVGWRHHLIKRSNN